MSSKMIRIQIILFMLAICSCNAQQPEVKHKNNVNRNDAKEIETKALVKYNSSHIPLYGKWKCVSSDYRGFQKFSLEKAKILEKSVLNIEANKMYYNDVDFIDLCTYHTLVEKSYDTSEYRGLALRYTKDVLARIIEIDPVDKNGEWSCYNDCAIFYLKDDTLINICGGYTLLLKKIYSNITEFSGEGTSTQQFTIENNVKELRIGYDFFKDKDELSVEDQDGRNLFRTGMTSTNGEISISLPIASSITFIVLKIKSSASASRWKLRVEN